MSDQDTRAFEMAIEIEASRDSVWSALTEAEELVRWFPLQARVRPGVGGTMWISWGGEWESEGRITAWEPPAHLRVTFEQSGSYDVDGRLVERGAAPLTLAIDYHLEARGGGTTLRLVHSGFGKGAEWDDEFDGISHGWPYELRSLRHYLQRHRGRRRTMGWARVATDLGIDECWRRLVGTGGFVTEGDVDSLREGDAYRLRVATGDVFEGVVQLNLPGRGFAGTVRGANDGLFRIAAEHAAGRSSLNTWLAAYEVSEDTVRTFQERARERLQALVR
jgi:uncharacterized protein YndB with AHSA1/START domain